MLSLDIRDTRCRCGGKVIIVVTVRSPFDAIHKPNDDDNIYRHSSHMDATFITFEYFGFAYVIVIVSERINHWIYMNTPRWF